MLNATNEANTVRPTKSRMKNMKNSSSSDPKHSVGKERFTWLMRQGIASYTTKLQSRNKRSSLKILAWRLGESLPQTFIVTAICVMRLMPQLSVTHYIDITHCSLFSPYIFLFPIFLQNSHESPTSPPHRNVAVKLARDFKCLRKNSE